MFLRPVLELNSKCRIFTVSEHKIGQAERPGYPLLTLGTRLRF